MKGLLYSSAFPSVETLSWNWDVGHNHLLKPAISVQDLFSQPLKALLVCKLFLKHQLKHMGKESWEKMVHFLHSCSAEKRLHGKASHLGRVLLWARASFLKKEASNSPRRRNVTLCTFFWFFSWLQFCSGTCLKAELSAPSFFCSSCFPAKDQG